MGQEDLDFRGTEVGWMALAVKTDEAFNPV